MVSTRKRQKTSGTQVTETFNEPIASKNSGIDYKELANVKIINPLKNSGGYRLWKKSFELHFRRHKVLRFVKQEFSGHEEVKTVMLNCLFQKIGKYFIDDVLCLKSPYAVWHYLEKRILGNTQVQLLKAIGLLYRIKYDSISDFVVSYRKQAAIVAGLDDSFTQHHLCLGFLSQLTPSAQRYRRFLKDAETDEDNKYTSLVDLLTLLEEAMPRTEYFR